jgi:hypothetical protein
LRPAAADANLSRARTRDAKGRRRTDGIAIRHGFPDDQSGWRVMLAGLAQAQQRLRQPGRLAGMGCREVTKAVLFPARFLGALASGLPGGNAESARLVEASQPAPIGALVRAAFDWRTSGRLDDPGTVAALLARGLFPLHLAMIAAYRSALIAEGEAVLAGVLERWAETLER